jgi:AcrR family transcriptional regulator
MRSERKEKIFKAALNMIKRSGIHGLAMGQLSKESGIAAGTFYHYFSSKEVMLQEIFLYCHKRIAAAAEKAIKSEESFEDRFRDLVRIWYSHLSKFPVEIYFVQEAEAGYSVSKNVIRESRLFYSDIFNFLHEGYQHGKIIKMEPKLMKHIILENIFSVIKFHDIFEAEFNENDVEEMLNVCWNGLKM